MKNLISVLILLFSFFSTNIFAQENFTEGKLVYDVVVENNSANAKFADILDGAKSVVYLKGNSSRTDFINPLGMQSTIINAKTNAISFLKEYGDQKFIINLTAQDWAEVNKKYNNLQFKILPETKTIAGYKCKKAQITLQDGSTIFVFFTSDVVVSNTDFLSFNKNLPGLIVEYESSMSNVKIIFSLSKINLDPVPLSTFDLPQSGYRVMTYAESKKLSIGGN